MVVQSASGRLQQRDADDSEAPWKKVHGISIGLFADEYRKIISLKAKRSSASISRVLQDTMTTLASQMDYGGFHPEDQADVIIDQNELESEAIRLFYSMKADPSFKYRHASGTACWNAEEFVGLQVADFVAYEASG